MSDKIRDRLQRIEDALMLIAAAARPGRTDDMVTPSVFLSDCVRAMGRAADAAVSELFWIRETDALNSILDQLAPTEQERIDAEDRGRRVVEADPRD